MDISVGKYRLRSDSLCLWVEEEYETKKSKITDIDYRKVAGYSRTIPQLRTSFLENKFRGSDAKEVAKLLDDLARLWEDMQMLDKAAVEKDFRMMGNKRKGE